MLTPDPILTRDKEIYCHRSLHLMMFHQQVLLTRDEAPVSIKKQSSENTTFSLATKNPCM